MGHKVNISNRSLLILRRKFDLIFFDFEKYYNKNRPRSTQSAIDRSRNCGNCGLGPKYLHGIPWKNPSLSIHATSLFDLWLDLAIFGKWNMNKNSLGIFHSTLKLMNLNTTAIDSQRFDRIDNVELLRKESRNMYYLIRLILFHFGFKSKRSLIQKTKHIYAAIIV